MFRIQLYNYTLIPNHNSAADGRAKWLLSTLITWRRGTDYAPTPRAGTEAPDWLSTRAQTFHNQHLVGRLVADTGV